MSATRYGNGWLSFLVVAGFLLVMPGSDVARAAMGGGHTGGGHVGAFGGGHVGAFGAGHRGNHRVGDRRISHGRHGRDFVQGFGWDFYDGYEPYEPDQAYQPYPRGAQRSGYCDVSPRGPYPQDCVWKDGP